MTRGGIAKRCNSQDEDAFLKFTQIPGITDIGTLYIQPQKDLHYHNCKYTTTRFATSGSDPGLNGFVLMDGNFIVWLKSKLR